MNAIPAPALPPFEKVDIARYLEALPPLILNASELSEPLLRVAPTNVGESVVATACPIAILPDDIVTPVPPEK